MSKKKLLAIASTLLLITACDERQRVVESNDLRHWEVIEIDSCEYIYGKRGYSSVLVHKGNCKYCEKRKKGS